MSAVICFPINGGSYEFVKIYRANSITGTYTNIATVNARQMEYEDSDGDYSFYYKVAFSDGSTEQPQIAVKSLVQQVINVTRVELKIPESTISDSDIDFLFDQCKSEVMIDICTYYYGVQLTRLTDQKMYQLPNRFFFDKNFGGVVSVLDFEFFKQTTPIYIYTEKVPVTPVYVDPEQRYVELAESLSTNDILKVNYYSAGRKIKHDLLVKLLAYKIAYTFYDAPTAGLSLSEDSTIKIGDITIKRGSSSSASSNADTATKLNAKYKQLVTNLKTGFFRTN